MRALPIIGLLLLSLFACSKFILLKQTHFFPSKHELFSGLAVEIGANIDSVRVLSVSTLVDKDNADRSGSIAGGTRLYIKVVGHDSDVAANNSIFVGPYECIIPGMINKLYPFEIK